MKLRRSISQVVPILLLLAYAGSFMALPVLHNHHARIFAELQVDKAGTSSQNSSHPDGCVVCSRISTTTALLCAPQAIPVGAVVSGEFAFAPTHIPDSPSDSPVSGRAPPSTL